MFEGEVVGDIMSDKGFQSQRHILLALLLPY